MLNVTYDKAMDTLETTLKKVTDSQSGGHTTIEDALFFAGLKLSDPCLWYSGLNDKVTFLVIGASLRDRKLNEKEKTK